MRFTMNAGPKVLGAVLVVIGLLMFSLGTLAQTPPIAGFWNGSAVPAFRTGNDSQSVELGMKFKSSVAGSITAIRFYKATNSRGIHTGTIWTSSGIKLASVTFTSETASGWQLQPLAGPLAIAAGTTYVVSYHTVQYAWDSPFFTQALTVASLTAPSGAGVYAYGNSVRFPTSTWKASNYWVDVVFQPSAPLAPSDPSAPLAPSITSQPVNRTVTAGQTASFSITASGSALAYQWRKNGAAISGATSSNYNMTATTSDNNAHFNCTVSNSAGSMTSDAATLTVSNASVGPSITSQPSSRTVISGQSASFSVSVSGTAPFNYQWSKNGAAISGATSSSLSVTAATSDNGARFTVTVSNAVGNVISNSATLTVNSGTLLLSANPGSLSFGNIDLGSSATQQVTLTNVGNSNVTLSALSLSGAGFGGAGVSNGQILTPGQTATMSVSFRPAVTGAVIGSVTVTSNAVTVTVPLSGSGVQQVSHTVTLNWSRSTSTVSGYQVYSSLVSGGPYTKLTTSPVGSPSFTDSSVQSGKTYYYVVTAVDASGVESNYSNQAAAIIQ